jgi:hypothetical protein
VSMSTFSVARRNTSLPASNGRMATDLSKESQHDDEVDSQTISLLDTGERFMPGLRDLGVLIGPFEAGPLNAITDGAGVRVGHSTIIEGGGALVPGVRPIRTGVTVILPREGNVRDNPAYAGSLSINGNGELTGLEWVRESRLLTTPIGLTNTFSVGVVRDALAEYDIRVSGVGGHWSMAVVGETYDGLLNDIHGQHAEERHVLDAIEAATSGPVAEGSVGGGTGMICHFFKGGIGTSSRMLDQADSGWTVGVLRQANYGARERLRVGEVPVGRLIPHSDVATPDMSMLTTNHDRFPVCSGQSSSSWRPMLRSSRTNAARRYACRLWAGASGRLPSATAVATSRSRSRRATTCRASTTAEMRSG